jgi:hypothetical protein
MPRYFATFIDHFLMLLIRYGFILVVLFCLLWIAMFLLYTVLEWPLVSLSMFLLFVGSDGCVVVDDVLFWLSSLLLLLGLLFMFMIIVAAGCNGVLQGCADVVRATVVMVSRLVVIAADVRSLSCNEMVVLPAGLLMLPEGK